MLMEKKSCNIRELANYLKVSPSTVSRVMNNSKGAISPMTRKRVLDAAKMLNYSPNINAQRFFSKRTNVVGLVIPSNDKDGDYILEDPHLMRVISSLGTELRKYSIHMLLLFADEAFIAEKQYLDHFRGKHIDSLLIWGCQLDETYHEDLRAHGFPYLFVGNVPKNKDGVNYVACDYLSSSIKITRLLIEGGAQKLLFLEGCHNISASDTQKQGVLSAMKETGLSEDSLSIMYGDFKKESGRKTALSLLKDKTKLPDAILTGNNTMAIGILEIFKEQAPELIDKIKIASLDTDTENLQGTALSAKTDDVKLGELAVETIIELTKNKGIKVVKLVENKIIKGL